MSPRVGRWGLRELVEPRLRAMVADRLGVDPDELTPDVSLPDELAADSLDLLEIALAAETEFGVVLPERLLEEVRTFGDLVDVVTVCVPRPQPIGGEPAPVWTRVLAADGGGTGRVERAEHLTPYLAQVLADEALRAGAGARLEIEVPGTVTDDELATIRVSFARLGARGVEVCVRRQRPFGRWAPEVMPSANASS